MSVELLIKQYLEFLTLNGGCTGSSESTLVKMSHCWKSHVADHIYLTLVRLWRYIYILAVPFPYGSDIWNRTLMLVIIQPECSHFFGNALCTDVKEIRKLKHFKKQKMKLLFYASITF